MCVRGFAAAFPSLLLLACTVESGNGTQNAEAVDANAIGPEQPATPPPEPSPPQQPGNNGQAPDPSGKVSVRVTPARTAEGSTVTLALTNGSKEQVGYNLCTSNLESSGGRPVPISRVCTMELRTLEPGRSADYRYRLPVNMVDGSYRFVTQVHRMDSARVGTVRSNSFEVR